jgi:hypothetical protein
VESGNWKVYHEVIQGKFDGLENIEESTSWLKVKSQKSKVTSQKLKVE